MCSCSECARANIDRLVAGQLNGLMAGVVLGLVLGVAVHVVQKRREGARPAK